MAELALQVHVMTDSQLKFESVKGGKQAETTWDGKGVAQGQVAAVALEPPFAMRYSRWKVSTVHVSKNELEAWRKTGVPGLAGSAATGSWKDFLNSLHWLLQY